MDSIRIQNLRSFDDTSFIDIRPLTLLVGQNSSGKSTFLRCFPLFKQSIEARTIGPILWNGRFIDFGSFNEAISTYSLDETITFHFKFDFSTRTFDPRLYSRRISLESGIIPFEISLKIIGDDQDKNQVSNIFINFANEHNIEIKFNSDGKIIEFTVNGNDFSVITNRFYSDLQKFGIIPTISERMPHIINENIDNIPLYKRRAFIEQIMIELKKVVHSNTKDETFVRMINGMKIGTSDYMLNIMKNIPSPNTWKDNVSTWTKDNQIFCRIRDLLISSSIPELLIALDNYFISFFRNIQYIAPIRATAERYYRTQNLAVDEIDFQGQNLAMFLRNLTVSELRSFQDWTINNFGFSPEVSSSSGHISLKLREEGSDRLLNLADKGFGFSQVLPILAQLWSIVYQRRKLLSAKRLSLPIIFAIEQPELHLHPKLQCQLLDAFVIAIKSANESNIDIRLIIETHSQTIINRLGHRIANHDFLSSDVNIVLFEKENSNESTIIRKSKYDDSGYLVNWPLGFFEPEDI